MLKSELRWGTKEYQNAIYRLTDTATKPFKIEEICAQLAWVRPKSCPFYPFSDSDLFETDHCCDFLVKDKYDGYICPNVSTIENFTLVITEKGTEEQKKALELLGDMYLRYGSMENPPTEPKDCCLREAWGIYKLLGLNEKLRVAEEKINQKSPYSNNPVILNSWIKEIRERVREK
jgi:hypothetical protein